MIKKILAVDTSTKACSVAICSFNFEDEKATDFKVLFQSVCNIKITHSQTIMPMVNDALKNSFINIEDIDYFACSKGPGSFTGLRIGISIIKGLSLNFDKTEKNVIAIDSLKAMAFNAYNFFGTVVSCMDARNAKVFASIYNNTEDEKLISIEENLNIEISALCEKLKNFKNNIIFVGDGANLCYNNMKSLKSSNNSDTQKIYIANDYLSHPFAAAVAFEAIKKIENNNIISCDELIPLYIQIPQAQRELEAKLKTNEKK